MFLKTRTHCTGHTVQYFNANPIAALVKVMKVIYFVKGVFQVKNCTVIKLLFSTAVEGEVHKLPKHRGGL